MKPCSKSLRIIIFLHLCFFFFFYLKGSLCADNFSYVPIQNTALDCGSHALQILSFDGRNWTGDVGSEIVAFSRHANSTVSIASSMDPGIPEVPYKTARLFYSEFTYIFNVIPGPKFVRLHFYPYSYSGLDPSKAFLSVTCGHYTLLSNFSASLAANYNNVHTFFKEFIIHVQNNSLHLTFSPSSNGSDAFAFVNGIEVVSMPLHLYVRGENVHLPFVGHPATPITLENTSALETLYRINVGGADVSPESDTGMFRTWTRDDSFIFGSAVGELAFDYDLNVRYTAAVPAYTAPAVVYRTGRFMGIHGAINLNYNLSWFFPVETGFIYLVRLHFCELDRNITKINQKVFSIYINNQTAEGQADVIAWSDGQGVPVYKDYITMFPQVGEMIQDLWLELHPNTATMPQYYDAFLWDLAGLNPPQKQGSVVNSSSRSSGSSKKRLLIIVGCSVSGVVLAFLIICVLSLWNRAASERKKKRNTSHAQSRCRQFSLREIKAATNNFDESQVIGIGGFGVVYKGYLDSGTTAVAIKRGNQASIEQGTCEFLAEIKTLSLLHHRNIVTLMGYCRDEQEMILVYEYMPNGTLFERLHFVNKPQESPLTWVQRLQICTGAAQGLCYLHTGLKHQIVHRDVKTSNILLDNNWVAKISDFGLSKIGLPCGSSKVKGSIGYLDPEYCRIQILTNKSDVYSFGVVLLEVLSAKFVVNPSAEEDDNDNQDDEETLSFVEWALNCYENADWDQLIDPHLQGNISPASLAKFLEITKKCLAERGQDRPLINEVLWNLELALELQMHEQREDRNIILELGGNSDLTPGVEFSEIMMPVGR
uniref:Protein kinase domain-containing protein n=1 Tax=Manihot esculenta TaxID=3983 RepID=A0A2C9VWN3_MANES